MKKITRKNLELFLQKHATQELILEIGGGTLDTNHSYSIFFPNRRTVDIDEKRNPDIVGDAHSLPIDDVSYEQILCTEVLEHLHTPEKAIAEMKRVLKPGGKLILTTRFIFPLHDTPHDYYRYTKYGLAHLFRDWDILELTEETETMSAVAAIVQRIGFQTTVRGGRFTKMVIYTLAKIIDNLNWILVNQYGDIGKNTPEKTILTTGYYLVVRKKTNA